MATSARARDGVVIKRPDLTLLDTREMDWQPFSGLDGGKVKVLSSDDDGNATVMMVWIPAGELPGVELPHRHYHRTISEFSLMISGELPHWEYATPEQQEGEMVLFREGFFMERRPGSLHGLEVGPTSATGCVLLMWRDGLGNWLDEPQAAQETIDVPYGASAAPIDAKDTGPIATLDGTEGVVLERPDLRLLDTRAMPWQDFGGLGGAKVKVLARDSDGEALVFLVFMPPGLRAGKLPHRHYHRTVHEYALIISGELPHWEYESADQAKGDLVTFREGFYMDRLPGSIHGNEGTTASPTGCVLLMWRDGPGNWLDEPGAAEETIEVPYPAGA